MIDDQVKMPLLQRSMMNVPHFHHFINGVIEICASTLPTIILIILYVWYSSIVEANKMLSGAVLLFLHLLAYVIGRFLLSLYRHGLKRTMYYLGFLGWKAVKGKKGYAVEMTKIRRDFQHSFYPKAVIDIPINKALPKESQPQRGLIEKLQEWAQYEEDLWNGRKSTSSGAVYHGGKELSALQNEAYSLFSTANPLHPDVFPFTRKMESEIIAMTISYFHGDPRQQKDLLTCGGTESICMAIRAYKNWAKATKSIYHPELVVCQTAHAAFMKACEMYGIKCVIIMPNPETFAVDPADFRKAINANTIAIVGSTPDYAHGVMDPITELSKLALEYDIGLHVDCCLGSFLLPTLQRMGYDVPSFDFEVLGVTSISADTHKFGYAQKGTSVVMFRDNALRRHAYFTYTTSSIGLYCTPTIAGSRSGGIVAACWSAMMNMGEEGYQIEAELIMSAVHVVKEGISDIDGIEVCGSPVMSVVAWQTTGDVHVYCVETAMSNRGWILNKCQDPMCVHICVTRANYMMVKERFVDDLRDSVNDVRSNPDDYEKCAGAMYGVAVSLPDASAKDDILHEYLDAFLGLVDEMEFRNDSTRFISMETNTSETDENKANPFYQHNGKLRRRSSAKSNTTNTKRNSI